MIWTVNFNFLILIINIDAENIAKTQDFDLVDKKIKKLQRKVNLLN